MVRAGFGGQERISANATFGEGEPEEEAHRERRVQDWGSSARLAVVSHQAGPRKEADGDVYSTFSQEAA